MITRKLDKYIEDENGRKYKSQKLALKNTTSSI